MLHYTIFSFIWFSIFLSNVKIANRMNALVQEFYHTSAKKGESVFDSVLFLSESKESWEKTRALCGDLPRGWYELSRISCADRIAFTRDFWIGKLSYHPSFYKFISDFFGRLDDVDVILSRESKGAPWIAEMVYSLKENRSFFRGSPPCKEEDLAALKGSFNVILPRDYLSFLEIHNGFGKLSELGLLSAKEVISVREKLMNSLLANEKSLMNRGRVVDPGALIPFFASFGTDSYQCFFSDWYPGNEMGNVYFSGIDYTLSECSDPKEWFDQLAFPTFLDWMAFYMEGNSQER